MSKIVARSENSGLCLRRCPFFAPKQWLIWVFAVSLMANAHAMEKGLTREQSQAVFEQNENYAVIVGVDKYDKLASLNYAVADAERLAKFFSAQGYEVELLTDYKASRERILDRIRQVGELATNGGTSAQGNVVFAYSGHGFQDSAGRNYLTTSASDPARIRDTALSMADLTAALEQSPVRQRVLFIDACRNDPSRSVPAANRRFSLDDEAEGLAILYSTRAGTLSWEDNRLGHGVFTHYFVEGLQGEAADTASGIVTFDRLQRYVQSKVKKHVRRRFEKVQIPYIGGERTGEFVLAMGERRSAPLPNAPEPELTAPQTGRLTVKVEPLDARVRIMNIVPRYQDGIELQINREYDVLVTRDGYEPWRQLVRLNEPEQVVAIVLRQRSAPVARTRSAFEPDMVFVRGGCYQMGSPESEAGRSGDERQRRVCADDVMAATTETTVAQYRVFVEATNYRTDAERGTGGLFGDCYSEKDGRDHSWRNPGFEQHDDEPVVCVSWTDAVAYVEWLAEQTGRGYRLPTEVEWEYTARAGKTTSRYWGDDSAAACRYANVADQALQSKYRDQKIHDCNDGVVHTSGVGRYAANGNGLFDMLGNVREWTCSAYDEGYAGSESSCKKGRSGRPAYRGGGWSDGPARVRAATRLQEGLLWVDGQNRFDLGFRVFQSIH